LPSGGWGIGCLTELLLEQHGIGELSLLLPGLRQVTSNNLADNHANNHAGNHADNQSGNHTGNPSVGNPSVGNPSVGNQWAALVNPPYLPYAPALVNAGINLERLLIINTDNDTDTLWATEQLLRAGIFAAVVSWVTRTTAQKQRRLQLAAELGKTWATVYRPASAQDQHSPAALRIIVSQSQHMVLDIIKARGGKQHTVYIKPSQFDQSQGVEWPAMPPEFNAPGKLASVKFASVKPTP